MTLSESLRSQIENVGRRTLPVGVAVLVGCALFGLKFHDAFLQSYLQAFIYWLGISCGSLIFLMIHHLVGGGWGFVSRRILEASTKTLPLMAVLLIPILLGQHNLYEWARPEAVAASALIQHKSALLNTRVFTIVSVVCFLVWIGLARTLCRWSVAQDENGDPMLNHSMRVLSGIGIVLYALTVTAASFMWTMSLEPEWFSSMWGPLFFVGQGLTTLSFTIVVLAKLSKHKPLEDVTKPVHFHDLGNLTFAFVILWTYMTFAQFLIIWSANLPEETTWYLDRSTTGWQFTAVFLALFHFVLPFFLLLSRFAKLKAEWLTKTVVFILLVRLVDLIWVVKPSFPENLALQPFDILLPIGMGGIWIWMFTRNLVQQPLVPLHDPRFEESLPFHGVADHG